MGTKSNEQRGKKRRHNKETGNSILGTESDQSITSYPIGSTNDDLAQESSVLQPNEV